MKKLLNQILKFGVVGGLAFIIDYGILIFLTEVFHINYLISTTISFIVSVIFNYIMSIFWVFDVDENKNRTTVFSVFIILSVIGLLLNDLFMWVFVDGMSIHYLIAKIIATLLVMIYNFITRKLFLEKRESNG
ncbi:sugar translocase [Massilimicrobiota sp. An142]|uniref:GtrA family protein n=1 Tax=Massilimicrobiota TaxID=1924110 RepID=UPI000B37F386|nr:MULTISPECIES: GtrA family protein [Massilimicrobiota]OUQ10700.1 sugar translocase [Massilimicrobiota sp. An142]HJA52368.1 GtrA family protein [Candidatus Massilimicrobiota merdigallinarum]